MNKLILTNTTKNLLLSLEKYENIILLKTEEHLKIQASNGVKSTVILITFDKKDFSTFDDSSFQTILEVDEQEEIFTEIKKSKGNILLTLDKIVPDTVLIDDSIKIRISSISSRFFIEWEVEESYEGRVMNITKNLSNLFGDIFFKMDPKLIIKLVKSIFENKYDLDFTLTKKGNILSVKNEQFSSKTKITKDSFSRSKNKEEIVCSYSRFPFINLLSMHQILGTPRIYFNSGIPIIFTQKFGKNSSLISALSPTIIPSLV